MLGLVRSCNTSAGYGNPSTILLMKTERWGKWWCGAIDFTFGKQGIGRTLRIRVGLNLRGFNVGFNVPSAWALDISLGVFDLGVYRLIPFSNFILPAIKSMPPHADLIDQLVNMQPMSGSNADVPALPFTIRPADHEDPSLWKDGEGKTPITAQFCRFTLPTGGVSWLTSSDLVESAPNDATLEGMVERYINMALAECEDEPTDDMVQKMRSRLTEFLDKYIDGTVLWRYANDAPLAGRWGYCITRGDCIVAVYQTAMS